MKSEGNILIAVTASSPSVKVAVTEAAAFFRSQDILVYLLSSALGIQSDIDADGLYFVIASPNFGLAFINCVADSNC